ncbi:hypothetical protein ACFSO0_12975 [Brevibacillus sp. GCM10020057]
MSGSLFFCLEGYSTAKMRARLLVLALADAAARWGDGANAASILTR